MGTCKRNSTGEQELIEREEAEAEGDGGRVKAKVWGGGKVGFMNCQEGLSKCRKG